MDQKEITEVLSMFRVNHPEWTMDWSFRDEMVALRFIYCGHDSTGLTPFKEERVIHEQTQHVRVFNNAARFADWVNHTWQKAWLHESSEWLAFKGKLFANPHRELAANGN